MYARPLLCLPSSKIASVNMVFLMHRSFIQYENELGWCFEFVRSLLNFYVPKFDNLVINPINEIVINAIYSFFLFFAFSMDVIPLLFLAIWFTIERLGNRVHSFANLLTLGMLVLLMRMERLMAYGKQYLTVICFLMQHRLVDFTFLFFCIKILGKAINVASSVILWGSIELWKALYTALICLTIVHYHVSPCS